MFILIILVFYLFCTWKLYNKAGQPGWASIVPIYNIIISLKVAKLSPWLIFLYLVPLVNFIFSIYVSVKTCQAFNKGTGFTLGYIFLSFIFLPILALGNSEYDFDEDEQ